MSRGSGRKRRGQGKGEAGGVAAGGTAAANEVGFGGKDDRVGGGEGKREEEIKGG